MENITAKEDELTGALILFAYDTIQWKAESYFLGNLRQYSACQGARSGENTWLWWQQKEIQQLLDCKT